MCKLSLPAAFVDALSDPRAFLSQEERRAKQMQDMGVDDSELADLVPGGATGGKPNDNPKKVAGRKSTDATANGAAAGDKKGWSLNAFSIYTISHVLYVNRIGSC